MLQEDSIQDPDPDKYKLQGQEEKKSDFSDHVPIKNWKYFIIFSYLYLLQGIISGIAGTMPFVYPKLPSTNTMALFNATLLPFSFQFFIAPFVEKFTIISYGKRKFWIVISTALGGILVTLCSFYTNQIYSNFLAIMFIVIQTFMAVLDIAAHAIMLKQLKNKSHTSIIMGYSQLAGGLIGGLILLKLTNATFAYSIGLTQPITTPKTILFILGVCIFVPAILIHFLFHETILQSELKGSRFNFGQIICYYKVCIKWSSRYFRTSLFQLLYIQGLNFFTALYSYQLVKAGFSRNTLNTLGNFIILPILIFNFFYGTWTNYLKGRKNAFIFVLVIDAIIHTYLIIFFPLNVWVVAITSFATSILSTWRFYLASYMINDFSVHALTGMYITFMASFANLGMQTSVQTWLSGIYGWKLCALIGTGIQLIIVAFIPKFYNWVQAGDSEVPEQIREDYEPQERNDNNQLEFVDQK